MFRAKLLPAKTVVWKPSEAPGPLPAPLHARCLFRLRRGVGEGVALEAFGSFSPGLPVVFLFGRVTRHRLFSSLLFSEDEVLGAREKSQREQGLTAGIVFFLPRPYQR